MTFDCNKLTGRLRDICRGHDSNGRPVLTPEKCEAYRQRFASPEYQSKPAIPPSTNQDMEKAKLERTKKSQDAWAALHQYAVDNLTSWDEKDARNWLAQWETKIPRFGCPCNDHWKGLKRKSPPDFSSPESFFVWSAEAHNTVNSRLGKQCLGLDECYAIYGFTKKPSSRISLQ